MEAKKNEQIYAFDSLYTTNHIQMLKILLPCLNPPLQKNLALYIKFLELRYTILFLNAHPHVINGCGFSKERRGQEIPIDDLLPFLSPKEAENMKQLQKSMDMIKQFSNMQKNLEALKGILPEGMDLENIFRQMGSAASDIENFKHSETSGDTGKEKRENAGNPANNLMQSLMSGGSSGDVLKNMMTEEQTALYEKFNKRFQDL